MKKSIIINLNGFPYHIDEDAYAKLDAYLKSLQAHFKNTDDGKEIIADIEARIAELFKDKTSAHKKVVDINDVEEVIGLLGNPADFDDKTDSAEGEKVFDVAYTKSYRRMYRDPDHRIIGGVCSGLGAYWGIDPVFIRILFIAITLLGAGIGLIIYIALWIILPEAITTSQKLEMMGEPVTVSNIGNFVRDEFEYVKSKVKFGKKKGFV